MPQESHSTETLSSTDTPSSPFDVEWHRKGACYNQGWDLFFHEGKSGAKTTAEKVKAFYCGPCPVRDICLQSALLHRDKHGIWGGKTPRERIALLERIEAGEISVDEAVSESSGRR